MLRREFLKQKLTIQKIGASTFIIGIVVGIAMALLLGSLFYYSREYMRLLYHHGYGDFESLSAFDLHCYNLFFAALATSLGMGFTIFTWFRGAIQFSKKRYLKGMITSLILMTIFITLMIFLRIGSILAILLYGASGYFRHLDLIQDFWVILILMPLTLFLSFWNIVILGFRATKWILISLICFVLCSLLISQVLPVDRSIIKNYFIRHNQHKYDYVKEEIAKARIIGVTFDPLSEQLMMRKFTEGKHDIVNHLKQAFASKRKLSLDTIIMEKIVAHNCSIHSGFYRRSDIKDDRWPYALPEDIYDQILLNTDDENAIKELFILLKEINSLFSNSEYRPSGNRSKYESERYMLHQHFKRRIPSMPDRITKVIDRLHTDPAFAEYLDYLE